MARYTPAYVAFLARVEEVDTLRKRASFLERRDPVGCRSEINGLSRACIVLLSSHVEGYVKEVGELALDTIHRKEISREHLARRFFYHVSPEFFAGVKDMSDPEKIAARVFSFLHQDAPYWGTTGPLPMQVDSERFNKGFSNPSFKKVKAYFGRFGYTNYEMDFYKALGAKAQATTNILNHLVDTRNNIAHGDISALKTPAEVQDMISLIKLFCRSSDDVFASWFRANICPIRSSTPRP